MATARVDAASEQAVREMLFAAAQAVERDADDIAGEIADVLMREVPEISADPETREDILLRGRAGLISWARAFLRGVAPDEVESPAEAYAYARALARRGVPLDVLLRIHRLGAGRAAAGVGGAARRRQLGRAAAGRHPPLDRGQLPVPRRAHGGPERRVPARARALGPRRGGDAARDDQRDPRRDAGRHRRRRAHPRLRPAPPSPRARPVGGPDPRRPAGAAAPGARRHGGLRAPGGRPAADAVGRRQHDLGVARARQRAAARADRLAGRRAERRRRLDRPRRAGAGADRLPPHPPRRGGHRQGRDRQPAPARHRHRLPRRRARGAVRGRPRAHAALRPRAPRRARRRRRREPPPARDADALPRGERQPRGDGQADRRAPQHGRQPHPHLPRDPRPRRRPGPGAAARGAQRSPPRSGPPSSGLCRIDRRPDRGWGLGTVGRRAAAR